MAGLIIATGCTRPTEGFVRQTLFLGEPTELSDPEFWTLDERFAHDFTCELPESVDELTLEKCQFGFPIIVTDRDHASFDLDVVLDAEEIDEMVLVAEGLLGTVVLRWAGQDQDFSEVRQLSARHKDGQARFDLGSHARFHGEISRLRISVKGRRYQPRRLMAYRRLPASTSDFQSRTWRRHDSKTARPARLIEACRELSIDLEPEVGDRLVFSLARGARARGDAKLELWASSPRDEGESRRIFDHVVRPDADPFEEFEVDITIFSGESLRLVATTPCDDRSPRVEDSIWWIAPRVVGRSIIRKPNVLLISIDTLRADHLPAYGAEGFITPAIDSLKDRGTIFEVAVAQAPWTLPSHATMLTGLDPLSHGANYDQPISGSLQTISELLLAEGFETIAVTGGGWLDPAFSFDQGFLHYRVTTPDRGKDETDAAVDSLLGEIDRIGDRRFFAFLHTYQVHSPFLQRDEAGTTTASFDVLSRQQQADEGFRNRKWFQPSGTGEALDESQLPDLVEAYDQSIVRTDDHLGRLIDQLEVRQLLDNTIIILTSDHGEAFGEHGLGSHSSLFDPEILVPLIFAGPGVSQQSIANQVRSSDLVPTILGLVGVEAPDGLDGTSLAGALGGAAMPELPDALSYAASSNRGVALRSSNGPKYFFEDTIWPAIHGNELLVDTRRDPDEITDLSSTHPHALSEMRARVIERLTARPFGYQIELENTSMDPVIIMLSSPSFSAFNLKSEIIPEGVRVDHERFVLVLELETDTHWSFHLLDDRGLELTLKVDEQIQTATLDGAGDHRMTLDIGGIQLALSRKGRDQARSRTENEELNEQLKALGYLQ